MKSEETSQDLLKAANQKSEDCKKLWYAWYEAWKVRHESRHAAALEKNLRRNWSQCCHSHTKLLERYTKENPSLLDKIVTNKET